MLNLPAKHPIWALLRLLIVNGTLIIVLWFTATKFDYTEIRTIITMFIGSTSVEGVVAALRKETTDCPHCGKKL